MAETILEVKHLKKYFKTARGTLHAVDDVSFTIEKGKTLGIVALVTNVPMSVFIANVIAFPSNLSGFAIF